MKKWIVMSLMAFGFSINVFAQEAHHEGPCAQDREKFCGHIEKGEGRVMTCMKENSDKLSSECKAHREKMKSEMKEMAKSCHKDIKKHCGAKKHDHGEKMKCMHEYKEKMGHSCQEHMQKMKGQIPEMKETTAEATEHQHSSEEKH